MSRDVPVPIVGGGPVGLSASIQSRPPARESRACLEETAERDPKRPKRTSENGEVEEAGSNNEVWVDFGWKGPSEGNFFRPFNIITAAAAAVADGG
jgi:hypothetical protein